MNNRFVERLLTSLSEEQAKQKQQQHMMITAVKLKLPLNERCIYRIPELISGWEKSENERRSFTF